MQYVEFMTTHGRSQRTWFTLTLQTAEAPGSVTITPRSLWRSLWGSKSEPRVGPDWFAEEWMIRGDDEAISQLLREDVLISLDDDSFRRHHHWIWRGHELTLLVRGWPTAEGVRTAAIMLLNIVQPSGILPNDNRPAGPGG
ncbi:MAG: hypothetical protein DHS20C14_21020 [Phycisphaeraceae bacterium]|nr:MAG: hypothetical protein DHS20C14_21020 [Phycisphaeraceae bacterium]